MAVNDLILLGRELNLTFTTTVDESLAVKAIKKAVGKFSAEDLSVISVFSKNKLKELNIVDLLPKGGDNREECFGKNFFESSRECKKCPDAEECSKVTSKTIYGVEIKPRSREGRNTMSTATKKTESKETVLRGGIKYRHVKAVVKGIRKWDHKFEGQKVSMVDGLGKKHSVSKDAISIATKLAKAAGEPIEDKSVVRHHLSLEEGKLIVLDKPVKSKRAKARRAKAASKPAKKSKSMKKPATTAKKK